MDSTDALMSRIVPGLALCCLTLGSFAADPAPVRVEVPVSESSEIDLAEFVARLAKATNVTTELPTGSVPLPVSGLAGNLTRKLLSDSLGPEVRLDTSDKQLSATIDPSMLAATRKVEWDGRVRSLAAQAAKEARRRQSYGMHALKSYRPNDPGRPTVCLVHGVNSSSYGFVHMIRPLEEAGYGIVVYDFAYNRSLEDSSRRFARDWAAFRLQWGEKSPWSIVGHSMGCLISREYVEGPEYRDDVAALILVAPVNQGSHLAKTQTLLQLVNSLQAVGGGRQSDALAHLGDGLGEAADDMLPGSKFLRALNARPRRERVAYHTLAGDTGIIPAATRRQIDSQLEIARRQGGVLGSLVRLGGGSPAILSDRLDELTDGAGDGCVSVARTKLPGVSDHVVIHANHAELIRAPLLYPDPGPVACMPYLLRWLPGPQAVKPPPTR